MNVLIASEAPLSPNLLRCGQQADLPGPLELHAGDLRLLYDGGGLRSICLGEHELVRRIYAAVRDRDWGTVPAVLSDVQIEQAADRFRISYSAEHRQGEVHFAWQGVIWGGTGTAGAITVSFSMHGQALSSFYKNRIGLCVLLPIRLAGAACSLEHVTSLGDPVESEQAAFPLEIDPRQPPPSFSDLSGLRFKTGEAQVTLTLDGDAFELEDQRNWTDASFKIYSTPLRLPYPVEIQAGTQVSQCVSVQVQPASGHSRRAHPRTARPVVLSLASQSGVPIPRIGLGCASHDQDLGESEIARLRLLRLDHLRLDLFLADAGYPDRLRRALTTASALSVGLHLGLHFSGEAELAAFAREHAPLLQDRQSVKLWLVYPEPERYHGGTPLREALALAQKYLSGLSTARGAFALGTDHDLIFLLRNPPPAGELQAVTFAINPQVHTFDNASVMETLEAQAPALQRARQLAGATPVMVSPITLKPRRNPYASPASSSGQNQPLGELPPQVDARQASLFTAAWTVGSLRALALGGAQSLTYYETTGWRGVMETASGSPMPELFHSIPGSVFPVYHVFAALAGFRGGEALEVTSSDPQRVQALGLRSAERRRLLVANLSPLAQRVNAAGAGRRLHPAPAG